MQHIMAAEDLYRELDDDALSFASVETVDSYLMVRRNIGGMNNKRLNSDRGIVETSFADTNEALTNESRHQGWTFIASYPLINVFGLMIIRCHKQFYLDLIQGECYLKGAADANSANKTRVVQEDGAIWCCFPLCRGKRNKKKVCF